MFDVAQIKLQCLIEVRFSINHQRLAYMQVHTYIKVYEGFGDAVLSFSSPGQRGSKVFASSGKSKLAQSLGGHTMASRL